MFTVFGVLFHIFVIVLFCCGGGGGEGGGRDANKKTRVSKGGSARVASILWKPLEGRACRVMELILISGFKLRTSLSDSFEVLCGLIDPLGFFSHT